MSAKLRAMIGGVAWIGWTVAVVPGLQHGAWAQALLLLAAFVLVPLALELTADPVLDARARIAWLVRWTARLQLPAAGLLALAVALPAGDAAALVALPWVIVTGFVAATGWLRLRDGSWRRPMEKMCGDLALVFLAVGGAWVFADRSGYRPLNFPADIVTLTAVHFHFAGLLLPMLAGRAAGWFAESRLASRAAVGAVLGVPAVAVGITTTQLGWGPAFESAAGCGLALAGMAVAILHVRIAVDTGPMGAGKENESVANGLPMLARVLFFVAGVSLFFGMMLAAAYAARGFSGATMTWLTVPWMRAVHGTVNALGFGLCGVLAWDQQAARPPRADDAGKTYGG